MRPDATSQTSGSERLVGLEVMRFVCAFGVVVYHYHLFFYEGGQARDFVQSAQPFFGWLKLAYRYGMYGVQAFWCISGFIFFWKYGDVVAQRRIAASRFTWLRFTRLYPLHLVTLVVVAGLQWAHQARHGSFYVYPCNDLYHFGLNLLLASAWGLERGPSFNAPLWSVSMEVLIYVFFFVATWIGGRSVGALVGWLLIAGAGVVATGLSAFTVPACLFCFYVGGLVAELYRRWSGSSGSSRGRTLLVTGIGTALVQVLLAQARQSDDDRLAWLQVIMALPLVMLTVTAADAWLQNAFGRCLAELGKLTYSSYLLHFPMQLGLSVVFGQPELRRLAGLAPFFCAYVLAVFVIGYVVHDALEMRAQNALRSWWKRRSTALPRTAVA